ncbi:threonine synthase [Thiorhodovibrio frisius]|uniref:Threonine synthase n=1 Tax=Thiorhodovibrio frisius TaxID=631362 RepID=H8YXF4_9GAMM|nr:threonine synthase [Thiorhodovibrio frisius]EIC23130.1 threonine synthase [Thiorhodovibrio frisius]WPL22606.1 Threonine synthase [Thiorhodovibrio frisius]
MKYLSTRGGVEPVGFAEAVMMGLATDGGLLVPESLPKISAEQLQAWSRLSFQDLACEVMRPFVGEDLSAAELQDLVYRSYASFQHPDITPLAQAGERRILELFHGPTAAFKDVALQFLGNLFEHFLARSGERLNIIGATSGDTGSAAIAGVRGKERIQIFILHPKGRVSPVQERQMTTVLDDNVHNLALRGTFDDAQRIVKALFSDLAFKTRYRLGAVNSINWARILAQTVYYFYAWGRLSGGNLKQKISFSVPTGNFGDVFAGYLARRMGLPIERLILATNRNDILTRFVHHGLYSLTSVHHTLSPAMDIQVASNFERYLYYLLDEDAAAVSARVTAMQRDGRIEFSRTEHQRAAEDFVASAVSDVDTLEQMRATYSGTGYLLCPHTAVGVRAAAPWPDAVCLATAHPAKFNQAVREAVGVDAPPPLCLQGLLDKPSRCEELAADTSAVRERLKTTLDAP